MSLKFFTKCALFVNNISKTFLDQAIEAISLAYYTIDSIAITVPIVRTRRKLVNYDKNAAKFGRNANTFKL